MRTVRLKLTLLALLLAACAGQPTATRAPEPTLAATALAAPTVSLPTVELTAAPTAIALTPQPTATEPSLFAPVTEADWQAGPADALVTLIEYGDFQ